MSVQPGSAEVAKPRRSIFEQHTDRLVLAFFAIAYALAWGIWILLAGLADNAGMETAEFGEAATTTHTALHRSCSRKA